MTTMNRLFSLNRNIDKHYSIERQSAPFVKYEWSVVSMCSFKEKQKRWNCVEIPG